MQIFVIRWWSTGEKEESHTAGIKEEDISPPHRLYKWMHKHAHAGAQADTYTDTGTHPTEWCQTSLISPSLAA